MTLPDNTKLLAVATLLGLSLFNLNRVIVKALPKIKEGANVTDLDQKLDAAMIAVETAARGFGIRGVVTSGLDTDPARLENSLHPRGLAIDARRVDWPNFDQTVSVERQRDIIVNELGDDFDVVIEPNHIHIEYDPKGIA